MKLLVFSARADEKELYQNANARWGFDVAYSPEALSAENVSMTKGFDAVQILVATRVDAALAKLLAQNGVRYLLSRTAGTDHMDAAAIRGCGLKAANVPEYSPAAIAEHTVMLALMLLRHMKRQFRKIESLDFTLNGLRGRELGSLTVGIFGSGRIGGEAARLFHAFGARVLVSSRHERGELKPVAAFVSREELFAQSDLLSFHCPLTPATSRMVDAAAIAGMKDGVSLINTARGGLFDFAAVLQGLESGKIASLGLDVYENENRFMRKNMREQGLDDPVLCRLLAMDQVILTPHAGFYTETAVRQMVETTFANLGEFAKDGACSNEL